MQILNDDETNDTLLQDKHNEEFLNIMPTAQHDDKFQYAPLHAKLEDETND